MPGGQAPNGTGTIDDGCDIGVSVHPSLNRISNAERPACACEEIEDERTIALVACSAGCPEPTNAVRHFNNSTRVQIAA